MKKFLTLATIFLLILPTFPVLLPKVQENIVQAMRGITPEEQNKIYNSVNVFRGNFSPSGNLELLVNKTTEVTLTITPLLNAANATISLILPGTLLEHVGGDLMWAGNCWENETIGLTFSMRTTREIEGYIRGYIQASVDGETIEESYYLRVYTPNVSNSTHTLDGPLIQTWASTLSSTGYITVKGRFVYLNEWGTYSSMRQCKVVLYDSDPLNPYVEVAVSETDDNGDYYFYVWNDDGWLQDGLDVFVGVHSENPAAITKTGDLIPKVYVALTPKHDDVPDGSIINYGTRVPTQYNEAWQAIDAALTEYRWIDDKEGWTRSKILMKWPYGTWPQHTYSYNRITGGVLDECIELPDKATAGWDHITVHHEYGHAVMLAAYGFNHYNMPPTTHGGEAHFVFSEMDGGFALLEGWAEFMQCAVDNEPDNLQDWFRGHGGNIEDNDWYNCMDTGDMDGNIIEGSVASILWDILDPVNDDDLNMGFDEIWQIIRSDNPDDIDDFWDRWFARGYGHSHQIWAIYYEYGINKDTTAPSNPDSWSGSHSIRDWSSDNTIEITWDGASDGISGVYGYSRVWDSSPSTIPDKTVDQTGTSCVSRPLSTGNSWYLHIRTVDNAGNWNPGAFHIGPFYIDRSPPTVSVSHSPTSPTDTSSVSFSVSASDDHSGLKSVTLHWHDGSWHSKTWSASGSSFSATYNVGKFVPRKIDYYATAKDRVNNEGRDPSSGYKSFTVVDDDITAPSFSNAHTSPSGTIYDTYNGDITCYVDITDSSGICEVGFSYRFTHTDWSSWGVWKDSVPPGTTQFHATVSRSTWINYVDQTLYFKWYAIDNDNDRPNDGLRGDSPQYIGPSIVDDDSDGPSISNVVVSEYNGDGDEIIEDDEKVKISWSPSDPSGIYSTSCMVDGKTLPVQDTYFVIVDELPPSDHYFTIYATDNDNDRPPLDDKATSSYLGSFKVFDDDTSPPTFSDPLTDPSGTIYDSYTGNIRLQINVNDPSGISIVRFSVFGSWRDPTGSSGNTYWYDIPRSEWTNHVDEAWSWKSYAEDDDNDRPNDHTGAESPSYAGTNIVDDDVDGPVIHDVIIIEYEGDGDDIFEDDEKVMIRFKVSDSSGVYSVECYLDGDPVPVYRDDDWYYVIVDHPSPGPHIGQIVATDDDNDRPDDRATTDLSEPFNVVDDDVTGPSLSNPSSEYIAPPGVFRIQIDATDPSGIYTVEFKYKIDEEPWSSWQPYGGFSGSTYWYDIPGDGETIYWQARAEDDDNDRPNDRESTQSPEYYIGLQISVSPASVTLYNCTISSDIFVSGRISSTQGGETVVLNYTLVSMPPEWGEDEFGAWGPIDWESEFGWAPMTIIRNVLTDSSGFYEDTLAVEYSPLYLGGWIVTATWSDYEASSTFSVQRVRETSSITISPSSTAIYLGESVTFTGQITPAHESATVIFRLGTYTSWYGSFDWGGIVVTATTSPDGSYSVTWTPDRAGQWVLQIFWHGKGPDWDGPYGYPIGDWDHDGGAEIYASVDVNIDIVINVSPGAIPLGGMARVTGSIYPDPGAGTTVYIDVGEACWIIPGDDEILCYSTVADIGGNFACDLTGLDYYVWEYGTVNVRARIALGGAGETTLIVAPVTVEVSVLPTSITLYNYTTSSDVAVSGQISPALPGETVVLNYTLVSMPPESWIDWESEFGWAPMTIIRNVITNSSGFYEDTFAIEYSPLYLGGWIVNATWSDCEASASFVVQYVEAPSQMTASASSTSIYLGESVTLSGQIIPAHEGVTVVFRLGGYTPWWTPFATEWLGWEVETTTGPDGSYSCTWTGYKAGRWCLQAFWYGPGYDWTGPMHNPYGDWDHDGAWTLVDIDVIMDIIIDVSPSTVPLGGTTSMTGTVYPNPGSGTTVYIDVKKESEEWPWDPWGREVVLTAIDSEGRFSCDLTTTGWYDYWEYWDYGTYNIRARLEIGGVSFEPATLIVSEIIHEAEISIDPFTAVVQPGSSVTYTVNIHNTGNVEDTYALTLVGLDSSWYTFSQTSVTVGFGDTVNVTLTVSPPYASMILKDYSFVVTATSQGDPSVSDSASGVATVDFTPTLPATPTGGLAIAAQPKTISMSPGTQIEVNILVVNNQNFDDAIWINLTVSEIPEAYRADLAWFNWTEVKVFIPAQSSVNIPLEITLPAEITTGIYVFRAVATSTANPAITAKDSGIVRLQ